MLDTNLLYRVQYLWKAYFLFVFNVPVVKILLSEVTYIPSYMPTLFIVVILFIYNTVGFTCFHSEFYSHPGVFSHLFIWEVCKTIP